MTDAKKKFQTHEVDSGQWRAFVKGELFDKALLHARSEFLGTKPTPEQQTGAEAFMAILTGLADSEDEATVPEHEGLNHNLDNPRPSRKQKQKEEKK